MVTLVPMTEDDFQAYYDRAIAGYAQENIRSGRWSAEEGSEQAQREYEELLPEGLATPNHFLYTVQDTTTQVGVGMFWYAIQEQAGQQQAIVYDIQSTPRTGGRVTLHRPCTLSKTWCATGACRR